MRAFEAVECPVCKIVMTRQGIWVHITGKARAEIRESKRPHLIFLDTKALKVPVTKYSYRYEKLKVIHENYYEWREKKGKKS